MPGVSAIRLTNFSTPNLPDATSSESPLHPVSSMTDLLPSDRPKLMPAIYTRPPSAGIRKMLSMNNPPSRSDTEDLNLMAAALNEAVNSMRSHEGELTVQIKRKIRREVLQEISVTEKLDKFSAQQEYEAASKENRRLPEGQREKEDDLYKIAVRNTVCQRDLENPSILKILEGLRYSAGSGKLASKAGAILDYGKFGILLLKKQMTPASILHRRKVEERRAEIETGRPLTLAQRAAYAHDTGEEFDRGDGTDSEISNLSSGQDETDHNTLMTEAGARAIQALAATDKKHLRCISRRLTVEDVHAVLREVNPDALGALQRYGQGLEASLDRMRSESGSGTKSIAPE